MPVLTPIEERRSSQGTAPTAPAPEARQAPSRFRRALPLLAMVAGLAVMALAALVMVRSGDSPTQPADPLAITLAARDVSVVTQVYEPGQDSGWHAHPGIHAVAVISGAVTVYDDRCQPQTVDPAHPYVGGQERHLVVNPTDTPAVLAVTYLSPSAPARSTEHMGPPAGCAAPG